MWGAHLRFTEAPLDLDNPAHLDALLRAYERQRLTVSTKLEGSCGLARNHPLRNVSAARLAVLPELVHDEDARA